MKVEILFNQNFIDTIKKFSKEKIKISEAISLAKILKFLDDELKIYGEIRDNILKEFKVKKIENNVIVFDKDENEEEASEDHKKDFINKINELIATEVKVDKMKLTKVTLETLNISTSDLILLEEIIDFSSK